MLADADRRDLLISLLDFHVAAGVDLALDEAPHDRFAEAAVSVELAPKALARCDDPSDPHAEVAGAAGPRSTHDRSTSPDQDRGASFEAPLRSAPQDEELGSVTKRFGPTTQAAGAQTRPALSPAATAPPDEIAADARARAGAARTLADLEAIVAAFDGCALKRTAKQLAFADGTAGARVMLIGEAPGAEEDRTGRPFVGRAGQLLDRMLAAIGLDRSAVYIANVVPWRPPGNRTPTPQEIAICLPFTLRQIELAAPDIVVTLGSPATQTLLRLKEGITKTRGRWSAFEVGGRTLRVLPMLHPAYLLRQPLHKRLAWRDLRLLKQELDGG